MILVIGGRSKIGSALIGELLARGHAVRALARASEGTATFPEEVDVARGDLADLESLHRAMDGIDSVFLISGPHEEEVGSNRNAVDAARRARVRLLVRSSILGSDVGSPTTFIRHHGDADDYLRASGVPHVILRPNLFLQNVTQNNLPSIGDDGNLYVNAGAARISMVDTRDVAAVAAVALTDPGHDGESYDVTGPAAVSYEDVADALARVLARPVQYVDVPDDAVRQTLRGYGMGSWMVDGLIELYQDYRRSGPAGYAAAVTDTVERLTGRAPRSLDDLLAELGTPIES